MTDIQRVRRLLDRASRLHADVKEATKSLSESSDLVAVGEYLFLATVRLQTVALMTR